MKTLTEQPLDVKLGGSTGVPEFANCAGGKVLSGIKASPDSEVLSGIKACPGQRTSYTLP